MAEYGDIASRAQFEKELADAIAMNQALLKKYPQSSAFESIGAQLDFMRKTTQGRDPTQDERESVDVGLVAVRELDGLKDGEVFELNQIIHPLAAFYEDWPTDEAAAREAQL